MSEKSASSSSQYLDVVRSKKEFPVQRYLILMLVVLALVFLVLLVFLNNTSDVSVPSDSVTDAGVSNNLDTATQPYDPGNPIVTTDYTASKAYPANFTAFGDNDEWHYNFFQVTVSGFDKTDNANYLLLEFPEGVKKAFYSGTLGDFNIESVYETDYNEQFELRDFDYVEEQYAIGDEIGIIYLSKYPAASDRSAEYCMSKEYFCEYADLSDYLEDSGLLINSPTDVKENVDGLILIVQFYKGARY